MGISVGFGKVDLTPAMPFPLAGVVVKGGRTATRVRDPLFARAVAFADGARTVCALSADLLVFHRAFAEAVEARLARAGAPLDGLLLAATHTHSAPGGYWDTPTAESFMGAYRQDLFDLLADRLAEAVEAARGDLRPAKLSLGVTHAPGLNWNRRHPDGPVDDHLAVLLVDREDGRHRVVAFGAHPVIAAEHESLVASADFPGEVVRALEAEGGHAVYVTGPVGGVSVLWPAPKRDLESHFAVVREALVARVREAEAGATPVVGDAVAAATVSRELCIGTPKLFPASWWAADLVALPFRLWIRRFVRRGVGATPRAPVTVLRVGDVALAGFPADMGPDIGLAARAAATEAGLRLLVAASHSNDFVGYVHLPGAYELPPVRGEDYAQMTLYENAMGACGREVGQGFVEQVREAFALTT